jgi:predicted transcriptional regulator
MIESFQLLHRMCYIGLGVAAGLEAIARDVLENAAGQATERYAELVERGERDHSALAETLRHRLDRGILTARDLQNRLAGFVPAV